MDSLSDKSHDIDSTIDFVNDIYEIIKREREKQPYNINIVDELRPDENAHTRILLKLLQFPADGSFPILKSFLNMTNKLLPEDDNVQEMETSITNPKIVSGEEFIDGLIEGNGQAIIIENKIHYAADQKEQIERYIKNVISHGISYKKIYVIYLTRNGSKKVQDFSFTPQAKEKLDYTEENPGRFIEMNYKDHILEWLKEDVLPNCFIKEDLLIAAIKQYVNHLEGLTLTRQNDKIMNENVEKELCKKLRINTSNNQAVWDSLTEERNKIETVLGTLDSIREEMIKETLEIFKKESLETLDSISPKNWYIQIGPDGITPIGWRTKISREDISTKGWFIRIEEGYIQVLHIKWPTLVHFEWYPITRYNFAEPNFEFRLGFHLEGDEKKFPDVRENAKKNMRKEVFETLKDRGLQIYGEPDIKLKHPRALFEKTYYLGDTSFLNAKDQERTKFIHDVYKDYSDFIAAFDTYVNENQKMFK